MKYKILKDGNNPVNCNSYLIYNEETKDGYIIDAPTKTEAFIKEIEEKGINLKYLLLTHGHWDHIMHLDYWRDAYDLKVVCHRKCEKYLSDPKFNMSYMHMKPIETNADIYLEEDNGSFDIFNYVYTPGHSFDSISFVLRDIVFCGDVIFYESVGRTDFLGSNHEDLINSIKNVIYKFDDNTKLLPGHGINTTVKHEKENNPFV